MAFSITLSSYLLAACIVKHLKLNYTELANEILQNLYVKKVWSKRLILSYIVSVYDPLGLSCFIILQAKSVFVENWLQEIRKVKNLLGLKLLTYRILSNGDTAFYN